MYVLIALAILTAFFLRAGIIIVKQSETIVIERFGRYLKTLNSGINIILPIIDQARKITWRQTVPGPRGEYFVTYRQQERIDLREAVFDFPKQNVITRDNVVTEINALLYFQIVDPVKALYEIENLSQAMEKLTQTTLRNVIGEMDLDETLTSRDTINTKLRVILDEATNKWGVKVNRVELQDINPPKDIRDAMEKQMRAERDRRARILEAEGLKTAQILEAEGAKMAEINKAEGDKQAAILEAEGQAEARVKVAEAEAKAINMLAEALASKTDPAQYLIAIKYIETLKEMVSGDDNKTVYLPYEASGILGSLGSIKDLFGKK